MKKMGILASLALCVTIGGVYAAWQFAETDVSSAYANVAVSLASKADATTKGSLEITSVNTGLKIDDPVDAEKHTTVLTHTEGGKFVITFVANANAPDEVLKNGIDLQWKVGLATSANVAVPDVSTLQFKYDIDGDGTIEEGNAEGQVDEIQEIFTNIDSTLIDVGSYKTINANENNGTVTFTYEVSIEDVYNKIELAKIVLDKEDMYNKYSEELGKYTLHFHVSEK